MSSFIHDLGLDRLPAADRLVIAQELWDSATAESHAPLAGDAQRAELRARLKEDDADPNDVVTWEEVKRRTAERLRG